MLRYLKFENYVAISCEYSAKEVKVYICKVKNDIDKSISNQLTDEAIILEEDFNNFDEANQWLINEFKFNDLDWKDYGPYSKDVTINYAFTNIICPMPQLISEKTKGELCVVVEQNGEGCYIHISGNKDGLKNLGKLLLLASDDYAFDFKLDKNWYKYLEGEEKSISIKIHNHGVYNELKEYPLYKYKDVIEFSKNCLLSNDS